MKFLVLYLRLLKLLFQSFNGQYYFLSFNVSRSSMNVVVGKIFKSYLHLNFMFSYSFKTLFIFVGIFWLY